MYTRILDERAYGVIDLVSIYTTTGLMLFGLEILQAFARYYIDETEIKKREKIASTVITFSLFACITFTLLNIILIRLTSKSLLGIENYEIETTLGIVSSVLMALLNVQQFLLRYRFSVKGYLASTLSYTVLTSAVSIFAVAALKWGVRGYFIGQILGTTITLLVTMLLNRGFFNFRIDTLSLKKLLKYSLPLVPSSISTIIASYIDRIMIRSFMSLDDVSVYSVASRFAMVITLLIAGFSSALNPLLIKEYKSETTPHQIGRILGLFISISAICSIFFAFFSIDIIAILTTKQYYRAGEVIPFLVLSAIVMNGYIFFPGLSFEGKTNIIAIISISGAVINSALNFLLVPKWGLVGAAVANLVNGSLCFILYAYYSNKLYPTPMPFKTITQTLGLSTAALIGLCMSNLMIDNEMLRFLVKILLFSSTAGAILIFSLSNANINLSKFISKYLKKY